MSKKKKPTQDAVDALKADTVSQDEDGLTIKQSRFVHLYLELGNASAAYRGAYDAESMSDEAIWVEACRLLQHPKVALKVSTLRKRAEDAAVLDRAWVLKRLMRNARIAMGEEAIRLRTRIKGTDGNVDTVLEYEVSDRDGSVANKSLELLGKLPELAMFIDRKEIGPAGAFDNMTKDELEKYVVEEAKALGLTSSPKTNGTTRH